MLYQELEKIGLNDKEAQLYLSLLELEEGNISQISTKSKIKRTTCYDIINSLKEKGLISQLTKKKKIYYYAEDPRKLEQHLEEKKQLLRNLMPRLLSITNLIDKKPKIRFFEGTEGVKEVYRDTLKYPGQETMAWASQEAVSHFDSDWLRNTYLPKRVENKIWQRTIAPDNLEIRSFSKKDQEHLRQTRFISKEEMPFEVEINLYGKQSIAIMSFQEQIGLIIESKKIFNTLKSIFEINWKALPK